MQIKYINGFRLRNAIIAGSENVFKMREHLNEINFFPIPDKDTGTNLTATLRNVVENMRECSSHSIHHVSQILAEAAVLGAQGNSGAILAQFFQGVADGLEGKLKVSTEVFSQATETAVQKIYKTIPNPVEGTIITVIQDWSNEIKQSCQISQDFAFVLKSALREAKSSLADTKYKIKALRKAGVVDAGAQGFVNLLEGISQFIEQGTVRDVLRLGMNDLYSLPISIFSDFKADIVHRYCVECLLMIKKPNKTALQKLLVDKGDSLAIAASKRFMKIHIHTNEPEAIKTNLSALGEIQSFQINDLIEQQRAALESQAQTQIALVTDSSCDLPHELITKYHVYMVPVRIHFGNETYIDKQTITPLEFYEKLLTSKIHPTTSQPTPADFKKIYEYLAKRYKAIISIHLADKLSGTFRAANTAAKFIDNTRMILIDSKTTSIGLGMLLIEAGKAIAAHLPLEHVVKRVDTLINKSQIVINLPSLKYLVKGGRISRGKGIIASLLNIKPLLTFDKTGAIVEHSKAFGKYGALKKTVKIVKSETKNLKNINIGIVHANAIGKAEWLAQKLASLPDIKSLMIQDVAPVLGVHSGPGTVGVAFWGEPF